MSVYRRMGGAECSSARKMRSNGTVGYDQVDESLGFLILKHAKRKRQTRVERGYLVILHHNATEIRNIKSLILRL